MSNNILIHKENDFSSRDISSIPLGNNVTINNEKFDLKKEDINNNIRPMLSGSATINIPEGKKIKIKPSLSKKVPSNTFLGLANNRRNNQTMTSDDASEEDDDSATNELLTNNSNNSNFEYNSNNSNDSDDNNNYNNMNKNYSSNKFNNNNQSNNDYEEDEDDDDQDENMTNETSSTISTEKPKQKTYEEVQQEKQKILFNLERLQKQGYPPTKKYSMASSFDDLNFEYERLKKQRDVEKSIKFSRKILMAFTSGAEFLNSKFDPFDIKLDGWSENMMENVNDYDEVFEELHEKYGDSVKMAPELKLLSMVAGSGFMFHLTNSLFKSASPKLNDILKQNPDIAKNISEAAAKNMNSTINQEFGDDDMIGNLMKQGINNRASNFKQTGPSMPQNKMNGPTDIDDLLDELNADDNASVSSNESLNLRSSLKKSKNKKKGGFQLDLSD
mgnify:CR=1 FL=1